MTRLSLTYEAGPPAAPPDVGDVLEDDDTGTLRRIDHIRPVTRGPNVGRRFYLIVTRITGDQVPDGADVVTTHRRRRHR